MKILKKKAAKKETEIIDLSKEKIEQPTELEIKEEAKKADVEHKIYRVLLAKPNYFILGDGVNTIRIDKKNNYHKNEEILY